jgi:hypothetical protein
LGNKIDYALYAYDFLLYPGVTTIFDESLSELFDQSPPVAVHLAIQATSEWTSTFSSTIYFFPTSSHPPGGTSIEVEHDLHLSLPLIFTLVLCLAYCSIVKMKAIFSSETDYSGRQKSS